MAFLQLAAVLVEDYDDAIRFFTRSLGFDLVQDSPARTNDGRPQRWGVGPADRLRRTFPARDDPAVG